MSEYEADGIEDDQDIAPECDEADPVIDDTSKRYAELYTAQAEGKIIQFQKRLGCGWVNLPPGSILKHPTSKYRIKGADPHIWVCGHQFTRNQALADMWIARGLAVTEYIEAPKDEPLDH